LFFGCLDNNKTTAHKKNTSVKRQADDSKQQAAGRNKGYSQSFIFLQQRSAANNCVPANKIAFYCVGF